MVLPRLVLVLPRLVLVLPRLVLVLCAAGAVAGYVLSISCVQ